MALILSLIISYFIGSIPTAYIFGKICKGKDIRKCGSGNVGATNAFRTLGPGVGLAVLFIDALKGFIPVILMGDLLIKYGAGISDELLLRIILGMTAVFGHSLSIFLKFKGGKGIAATLGVLIGLSVRYVPFRIILILEVLIWALVFLLSRIVSLASLVSVISFPLLFIFFRQPFALIALSVILSLFIIFRHKSNLYRLLQGKESGFRRKKAFSQNT